MKKQITKEGKYTILPVLAEVVSEISISLNRLPIIYFQDPKKEESELIVSDVLRLVKGKNSHIITGARPGKTWDPRSLYPLIDLIGNTVEDAMTTNNGFLSILLSNNLQLHIGTDDKGGTWHFQYPRSRVQIRSDKEHRLTLVGESGKLH